MSYNPQFAAGATPASVVAAAAGGTLLVYGGTQPPGPAVAAGGQPLLASLPLPPFTAPVVAGDVYTAEVTGIPAVKALQAGTATWFRVTAAGGTAVFDGAAGAAGSDLTLSPTTFIAAGVSVTITGLAVTGEAGQDVTGSAAVTVPPPGAAAASGYAGTEPVFPGALTWCGYQWEVQGWGAGSGWPAAGNVTVDASGYLNLRAAYTAGQLAGAETDSVRGDQGVTGNPSRWGYGTYRWVVGTDLAAIDPTLVLGLFTFQAYGGPASSPANPNGKGGPAGQKEIDIEVGNWEPEGTRSPATFYGLGFYQDTGGGATAGVPETYGQVTHTMTAGSQAPVPPGHPVSTAEFVWTAASITWNIWYGTATTGPPDYTLTMTEGQAYTYVQPYGGNTFAGTVRIPAPGGHQVIMNLWSQGQNVPVADTTVVLRSFSYTPPG